MLNLLNVNPTGLFSYGYSTNIDINNKGLVNLIGINEDEGNSSNGSGKTSLFNSICELLFGDNPTDVNGPGVVNSVWSKGCCGRIEFISWEKVKYRITLCRDWKENYYIIDNDNQVSYNGTGLFLDKYEDGIWKDCRGSGMPDTRKKILTAVGMPYNRFISIAYMSHRIGNKFLRGTNKDRMDILSGITGVEEWDKICDKCRGKKKELETEIRFINDKISFERGGMQELIRRLDELKKTDWKRLIENHKQTLLECQTDEKICVDIIPTIDEKKNELNKSLSNFNQRVMVDIVNKIRDNESAITNLRNSVPGVSYNSELSKELNNKNHEINFVKGQISSFENSDGALLDLNECPTCGAVITKARKAKIEKSTNDLLKKIKKLELERNTILKSVEDDKIIVDKEINELRLKAQEKINIIISENSLLDLSYKENLLKFNKIRNELEELNNRRLEVERDITNIRHNISETPRQIELCQKNIEYINRLNGEVKEREETIKSMNDSVLEIAKKTEILTWLIHNIPYIKLHKLSASMVVLSDYINNFLSEMGDTIRVDVKAFDEKKLKPSVGDFTDLLKGEVNVEITDGDKKIDPRLYSEGEMGKISNAFVRALRELALKSGYGCNILMLDEMFSFIDYANSQKLANSFVNNIGTTVITDNSERAGDLIEFDEVWVARKRSNLTAMEFSVK